MRQAVAFKEELLDFMHERQRKRYWGKTSRESGSIKVHEGESPSLGALARTRKLSLWRCREAWSEGDVGNREDYRRIGRPKRK